MQEGGDEAHLARFCELPYATVKKFVRNLRRSRAWNENGILPSGDYCNEEEGGIAFWMDVCAAQGLVVRAVKGAA